MIQKLGVRVRCNRSGITEFPFSELISFKEVQEELGLKHETEVLINELVKASSVLHVKTIEY